MEGPTGVLANQLTASPASTARVPSTLATAAICAGVWVSRRALAAGITSREVINNTPTVRMAPAISRASNNISSSRVRCTATPSTWASSSLTVMLSRARHCHSISNRIRMAPAHRARASCQPTASRSPNR